jgi:DNA polymerase alpha subunit A
MKWVTRNYAFEDRDVPVGGSRWLKVVYGFDREFRSGWGGSMTNLLRAEPQIEDKTSSSISKIMGTNTSAFELLVVKRKIMGPCWLRISGVTPPSKAVRQPQTFLLIT